jgi:hypothetical protein
MLVYLEVACLPGGQGVAQIRGARTLLAVVEEVAAETR